jgi:Fur family ferric uptake transcriptional regulator
MTDPARHRARQLNERLARDLYRLLERRSEPLSDADRAVVEAFCRMDRHLRCEQFAEAVRSRGGKVPEGTVQRVMDLLCDLGFAVRRDFGDGPVYEHLHLGEHHDHLICTQCGEVIEFIDPRVEQLQEMHAASAGFRPLRHKLEIYGICRRCAARLQPTRPLTDCQTGEKLRVVRIDGGGEVTRHLQEMGLVPGAPVEVLARQGSLMLAVGDSRLGLEPETARHVLVAVADAMPPPPPPPPLRGRGRGPGFRWRHGRGGR